MFLLCLCFVLFFLLRQVTILLALPIHELFVTKNSYAEENNPSSLNLFEGDIKLHYNPDQVSLRICCKIIC